MRRVLVVVASMVVGVVLGAGVVVEGARELPLVQDVDVVVVGGSSGAVAAALKVREAGASVFLVAPRPYLGEDMAGKLRLSVGDDEDSSCSLIEPMFRLREERPPSLPFTYTANKEADRVHLDTSGKMLADGKWHDAPSESVQYSGDVTHTLDLGAPFPLTRVVVAAFHRSGEGGFLTSAVEVEGSRDNREWHPLGRSDKVEFESVDSCMLIKVDLEGEARYLRITSRMGKEFKRQLLAEFYVYGQGVDQQYKAAVTTTPLQVKRTLDQALLQAEIPFLTGAVVTEVLEDEKRKLSGVVIANRSGRQAIRARVVIDATERGGVAQSAGARSNPFPAGNYTFRRTIIAGEPPKAEGVKVQELFGIYEAKVTGIRPPKGFPDQIKGRMYLCDLEIPMRDGSMRSFAEAEQRARDLTFVPTQLESADTLHFIPPDNFAGMASSQAPWQGAGSLDLGTLRPQGVDHLYVLGPRADISRSAAEALMQPGNLMAVGERVGKAAAAEALKRTTMGATRVRARTTPVSASWRPSASEKTYEHNRTLPPYLCNASGSVAAARELLPILAECDVVVAGAGTGGGPAGIAAARQGARVIVCDYLWQMGGVQTDGLIGLYYWGNRVGFTTEVDEGVKQTGAVLSQCKSEWYRHENRKAGSEVWYGTMVTGVVINNNRVTGVVVVTPYGERGVISCKVAIDATGNAELAAMAGEETEFITADELALQGVGQTPRNMGASYTNTDVGFLDDTDAADLFFFALRARLSFRDSVWDQAQVINSRERRRLKGVTYISPMDVTNERTYPDVVVQTYSNFDSHGHTVHENFFIEDPGHHGMRVNLPYSSFLPRRVDGLLVIGLGLSAHRDAMPILRMQPDVQNQGYAAGTAAAMAVADGVEVRRVNMPKLQRHLISKKIVPADVLKMRDSFPLSEKRLREAVASIPEKYKGLDAVLTDYKRSVPLLRAAFRGAGDAEAKFKYGHVLAMMGESDGEELLIERVRGMEWDKGWNFRGMGQFNRSVSWVDSYIIALGRCKSKRAVDVIIEKAGQLTAKNEFSHFRAVAMALELIGDKRGAPVLSELLQRPEISGHAIEMGADIPPIPNFANVSGDIERTRTLRELAVARALYRLGDHEGRGVKVLESYARDPRRAYATHVQMVLK